MSEGRNGDWPGQYGDGDHSLDTCWIMNENSALTLHCPPYRSMQAPDDHRPNVLYLICCPTEFASFFFYFLLLSRKLVNAETTSDRLP